MEMEALEGMQMGRASPDGRATPDGAPRSSLNGPPQMMDRHSPAAGCPVPQHEGGRMPVPMGGASNYNNGVAADGDDVGMVNHNGVAAAAAVEEEEEWGAHRDGKEGDALRCGMD